jgi:hypothetical protein
MRKDQKYSKEEMYLAIEIWHESGLTQAEFCKQEKIPGSSFYHWVKKYKKEKEMINLYLKQYPGFIPVKVSPPVNSFIEDPARIEISFPNGVRLSFPAGTNISQLKTLINY